ncbi:MAG: DUF2746 domain-containing protein [Acidobacteria bacterium]|nr:DUF2746 domain-containing protein [Acidobacteriota bacterium]
MRPVNTIFNPDSWLDVLTILATTFMVVALPLLIRQGQTLGKLDRSVSNGHTRPLRMDVDEVKATLNEIRGDLHHLRTDIHDVRSEIRQERHDRLDLERRLKP